MAVQTGRIQASDIWDMEDEANHEPGCFKSVFFSVASTFRM